MRRALDLSNFEVSSTTSTIGSGHQPPRRSKPPRRACAGNHLHRYIFMSSVGAYGDGLNHTRAMPGPDDHPDPYVRNKAMSERALFRLHQRIGLPIVTIRPPFIYGSGNPFYREAFFWDRMRDNRPIVLPATAGA